MVYMNTVMTYQIQCKDLADTLNLGARLGSLCRGGECFELVSDLGGGKTAFVRGLAIGIGADDDVSSPSFTINNSYQGSSLILEHFDFYRLSDAGIVAAEMAEDLSDSSVVVAVEWGEIVHDVLPIDRVTVGIAPQLDGSRVFKFTYALARGYLFQQGSAT